MCTLSLPVPENDSFCSLTGPPQCDAALSGPKVLTPAPNVLAILDL